MLHSSFILTLKFRSFIRKEHKKCEFEVHEVYAVDILMSSGEGKAKEREARTTVYKRTDIQYSLKMKASRGKYFSMLLCYLVLGFLIFTHLPHALYGL